MLHGEADSKVMVGALAWDLLRTDAEYSISECVLGKTTVREAALDILNAVEERILSSIRLGGF